MGGGFIPVYAVCVFVGKCDSQCFVTLSVSTSLPFSFTGKRPKEGGTDEHEGMMIHDTGAPGDSLRGVEEGDNKFPSVSSSGTGEGERGSQGRSASKKGAGKSSSRKRRYV